MTDLKALRMEIAESTSRQLLQDWPAQQRLQALFESALLQYAEAVLGEPSEGMLDFAEYGGGPVEVWNAMASQRLKEIK